MLRLPFSALAEGKEKGSAHDHHDADTEDEIEADEFDEALLLSTWRMAGRNRLMLSWLLRLGVSLSSSLCSPLSSASAPISGSSSSAAEAEAWARVWCDSERLRLLLTAAALLQPLDASVTSLSSPSTCTPPSLALSAVLFVRYAYVDV